MKGPSRERTRRIVADAYKRPYISGGMGRSALNTGGGRRMEAAIVARQVWFSYGDGGVRWGRLGMRHE
jgi:hypothetical protein